MKFEDVEIEDTEYDSDVDCGMKTIAEMRVISEIRGSLLPPSYVRYGELRLARAILEKKRNEHLKQKG